MRWPIGQRLALSRLSVIVVLVLGSVAIGASLVTRSAIRDQERRLLDERSKEIAATATTSVNDLKSLLGLLAGVPSRTGDSATAFANAADPLLGNGIDGVGVADERGGRVVVLQAIGAEAVAGSALTGEQALLVRRALSTRGLVTGVVHGSSAAQLSVTAPGRGGTVAYEETAIDPTRPVPTPPGSPYSDLNIALYASTRAVPAQLVLTTSKSPSGSVVRRTLTIGADRWLLLTSSSQPLVGSFTSSVPWVVFAAALFSALLAAALVEQLARRRRYALGVVEQRTAELRQALDEQVRLQQEQRQARDAADAANRAKSEFLSRMSHELRTPLNAIMGFGQLLELELAEPQRDYAGHILKGGRHLLELINEVLELSRIEAGELQLSPEPVPLEETVREALALVDPLAAKQDITLSLDTGTVNRDVHVLADRQRLKQVMLNLLSNAIKYNRVSGRVHVSFEQTDAGRTRIAVADSGIGIPPDRLDRLFEPFARLGAEYGEIEGTGLGLALVKRLVEAMGGSIELESDPGKGSVFTIELEAVEGPENYEAPEAPVDLGEHVIGLRRHRILYIEDNLSNLTLVERILERQDAIQLVPAMQGRLGLELAGEHHPDLIVLDLHLPDISGEEVLRRLKADDATRMIPVIILSADASKGQIARLLELGAHAYLTKPLDIQHFLDLIAANLDRDLDLR